MHIGSFEYGKTLKNRVESSFKINNEPFSRFELNNFPAQYLNKIVFYVSGSVNANWLENANGKRNQWFNAYGFNDWQPGATKINFSRNKYLIGEYPTTYKTLSNDVADTGQYLPLKDVPSYTQNFLTPQTFKENGKNYVYLRNDPVENPNSPYIDFNLPNHAHRKWGGWFGENIHLEFNIEGSNSNYIFNNIKLVDDVALRMGCDVNGPTRMEDRINPFTIDISIPNLEAIHQWLLDALKTIQFNNLDDNTFLALDHNQRATKLQTLVNNYLKTEDFTSFLNTNNVIVPSDFNISITYDTNNNQYILHVPFYDNVEKTAVLNLNLPPLSPSLNRIKIDVSKPNEFIDPLWFENQENITKITTVFKNKFYEKNSVILNQNVILNEALKWKLYPKEGKVLINFISSNYINNQNILVNEPLQFTGELIGFKPSVSTNDVKVDFSSIQTSGKFIDEQIKVDELKPQIEQVINDQFKNQLPSNTNVQISYEPNSATGTLNVTVKVDKEFDEQGFEKTLNPNKEFNFELKGFDQTIPTTDVIINSNDKDQLLSLDYVSQNQTKIYDLIKKSNWVVNLPNKGNDLQDSQIVFDNVNIDDGTITYKVELNKWYDSKGMLQTTPKMFTITIDGYKSTKKENENWISNNWWVIVIAGIGGLVIILAIILFSVNRRRKF